MDLKFNSGKDAYEYELTVMPEYPNGGGKRVSWDALSEAIKANWNKNPTPRYFHDGDKC